MYFSIGVAGFGLICAVVLISCSSWFSFDKTENTITTIANIVTIMNAICGMYIVFYQCKSFRVRTNQPRTAAKKSEEAPTDKALMQMHTMDVDEMAEKTQQMLVSNKNV